MPTKDQLEDALSAAGNGHHDYESNYLKGKRDEQWAGWYAAFVLGRLGEFASPSAVAVWLEEAEGEGEWPLIASEYVFSKINGV